MNRKDIETRMQLTATCLIQPAGGNGYLNMGDLDGHKRTVTRGGAPVLKALKGFHRMVRSLTAQIDVMWEFKLREQNALNMGMLLRALGSPLSQAQTLVTAPTGTASFTAVVQGRSYFIGKYALDTVVVKVGGVTKTVDVDYTIDVGTGELYILPAAPNINNGDNVAVTFGCAALNGYDVFTTNFGEPLADGGQKTGSVKLYEFDQHAARGVPRRLRSFTGQYWIEGDEAHDGKKPVMNTLKILAVDKPTVQILK